MVPIGDSREALIWRKISMANLKVGDRVSLTTKDGIAAGRISSIVWKGPPVVTHDGPGPRIAGYLLATVRADDGTVIECSTQLLRKMG